MIKPHGSTRLLAGAAVVAALGLAGAAPAQANELDVVASGGCSGTSTWELKASPDDGLLEVEFEVDSNTPGQVWQVKLTDNATKVAKASMTTAPPSGSFSFERRIANLAGTDVIKASATFGGEKCVGSVSI